MLPHCRTQQIAVSSTDKPWSSKFRQCKTRLMRDTALLDASTLRAVRAMSWLIRAVATTARSRAPAATTLLSAPAPPPPAHFPSVTPW